MKKIRGHREHDTDSKSVLTRRSISLAFSVLLTKWKELRVHLHFYLSLVRLLFNLLMKQQKTMSGCHCMLSTLCVRTVRTHELNNWIQIAYTYITSKYKSLNSTRMTVEFAVIPVGWTRFIFNYLNSNKYVCSWWSYEQCSIFKIFLNGSKQSIFCLGIN